MSAFEEARDRAIVCELIVESRFRDDRDHGIDWTPERAATLPRAFVSGAISALSEANSVAPGDADTLCNLGVLLADSGRPGEALDAFSREPCASQEPGHRPAVSRPVRRGGGVHAAGDRHRPAGISPGSPARVPGGRRDREGSVFNSYSPRFENHLMGGLQYRAPWLLAEAVARELGSECRFLNALDLGCGTGLGGMAFRGRVDRLTGMDLAVHMAERASVKNVYDVLRVGAD